MKRGLALSSVDIPMAIMGCGENRVGRKARTLKSRRLCFFFSLKKKVGKTTTVPCFQCKKGYFGLVAKDSVSAWMSFGGPVGAYVVGPLPSPKGQRPSRNKTFEGN